MNSKKKGKLFVFSGPSGVGKTTICKKLCENIPKLIWSVSATSRPKRQGEKEGQDYFFISEATFLEKIKNRAFIEYAKVHNSYYGTLKKTLDETLKKGYHCLVEIDVQGARQIKENQDYDAILIFLAPPDIKTLEDRLYRRNSDANDVIKQRLENAKHELSQIDFYDYCVTNSSLEESITNIQKIMEDSISAF